MPDIKTVAAPSLPSGEYRLRTTKAVLVAVADRLMGSSPLVSSLIDVPSEDDVAAWDRLLETTDDVSDVSSEEEWAALAVPLVNAMRTRILSGSPSSFPGCMSFLTRCPPAVAWFALRNSMAWESENRTSGPCPKGGMELARDLFGRGWGWVEVFARIRKSDAFAA